MPEAVAAPAVESAVVACFENGVVHIVPLDEVAAECAFTYIDPGARYIMNGVMRYMDLVRDADLYAGGLFLDLTGKLDQVIGSAAVFGVII